MATYAPSIYDYATAQEWEQAAREWADENEPKEPVARISYHAYMTNLPWGNPLRRFLTGQEHNSFDTPEQMNAWIKEMEAKGYELIRTSESVDNLADLIRRRAEAALPGGTREEYRALGLTKF